MEVDASSPKLSAEGSRLFRIWKTSLKMLSKRGYTVMDEFLHMTTQEFFHRFGESPSRGEQLEIMVEKADDPTDQLVLHFPDDEKVGVTTIQAFCENKMKPGEFTKAILVVRHSITPFAKQAIQQMALGGFKIEYFRDSELLVDITEHRLVPTHHVLDPTQKTELLKRYRLREGQLPRIQKDDPVARFYGLEKGQVVKIIRTSETAGRYVTYRVCI